MMHLASGGRRSPKCSFKSGFKKQRTCLGLFTLHSSAGVLSGVICLHVDDMLGTGDDLFELKLNELDKLVGFGSMKRQKFDHCGRQNEKHHNGEIKISMNAYILNLEKVCLSRERMKQLDDELSATESHEFRGINGCLQRVTKELLYPCQCVVKVLQRRQGQARLRDLIKAIEVIDEIKQHEDFTLTHRILDLTSCGLIGVSDASLGGVDRFGYPTDQDSKTVKVYSQAGIGIFIGEKSLVSLGARGKFNVLDHKSVSLEYGCRNSWFGFASGLNAVLWRSAERDPWRKCTIVQETTLDTEPDTVVQDSRDGCPRRP